MALLSRCRQLKARSDNIWRALPKEAQRVYPQLNPDDQTARLGQDSMQLREKRIALEALFSLCRNESEMPASEIIPRYLVHLRGTPLERTLYPNAVEARNSAVLKAAMTPAILSLMDAGVSHINRYVTLGRPFCLDHFRSGFVTLKTAALFAPETAHDVEGNLKKAFGSRTSEFPIIEPFLPSVAAWGSDPKNISVADMEYLNFWRRAEDSVNGKFHANHVLAYYAPPRLSWRLMGMKPETARIQMEQRAPAIRESLIDEASRKVKEKFTNAAWAAATFVKVQLGIRYLDHGWDKLSKSQAHRMQDFILFARDKIRNLDGEERRRLRASMGSVESALIRIKRYELKFKVYQGSEQLP